MEVKPFVHHRLGESTTVFGIWDHVSRLWFIWCYRYEDVALRVSQRLTIDSAADRLANWRKDPQSCVLSERKE